MRRQLALAVLAVAATAALSGAGDTSARASDRHVAQIADLAWSPDGAVVAGFVVERGRRTALASWNGATGEPLWLLPLDRLRQSRWRRPLTVDSLALLPGGQEVVLLAAGDLFVATAATGQLRLLTQTPEREESPIVSPDGARVAYLRAGRLFVKSLATDKEIEVGQESGLLELGGRWGESWSSNSASLAFVRLEGQGVRIGLVDLADAEARFLDTGPLSREGHPRLYWKNDGLTIVLLSTGEGSSGLTLRRCRTDRLFCRPLVVRPGALPPGFDRTADDFRLADGGFVWLPLIGEATGLARFDELGRERRRLLDGWSVARIEAQFADGSGFVVSARRPAASGTEESAFLLLSSSGAAPVFLAGGSDPTSASFSPTTRAWARGERRADGSTTWTLVSFDSGVVTELRPPTAIAELGGQ